ncbi:MAG: hypothetical protein AAF602_20385 [Myxococcota bacterium]
MNRHLLVVLALAGCTSSTSEPALEVRIADLEDPSDLCVAFGDNVLDPMLECGHISDVESRNRSMDACENIAAGVGRVYPDSCDTTVGDVIRFFITNSVEPNCGIRSADEWSAEERAQILAFNDDPCNPWSLAFRMSPGIP